MAQQVEKSAESVQDMTYKIEDVNVNISAISERMEISLQKLS
ncbi:MAG: hypothetical protein PHV74_08135 [Dehalococcoidia bacterium]|nr:hypothetical protein [Dehalococcoidia bacterium]